MDEPNAAGHLLSGAGPVSGGPGGPARLEQQNDGAQLVAMLDQVQENVGEHPKEVSADAGYCCLTE